MVTPLRQHDPSGPVDPASMTRRRLRVLLTLVVLPLVVATGIALVVLWPPPVPPTDDGDNAYIPGTVVAMRQETCPTDLPETPTGIKITRCGTVDVAITGGPDGGTTVVAPMPDGPGAPTVNVGDDVLLLTADGLDGLGVPEYGIVDHQRGQPILILALIFAAATVIFARWRGLAALAGLGVSFTVMLAFVVPAMMNGQSPLLVAIVGAATIMFAVLYLTHGVSVRTTVAVLGTFASLVLTGVGGSLAATAAHLTGFGSEQAGTLAIFYRDVDLHGLLLAGIVIGSLGVLDDITVTQAAVVTELAAANPGLTRLQLYRAAARVGRAHIASVINTLVLAYAGSSLPLLLLIAASGNRIASVLTSPFVGEEIVRSAVGSLGLIAAVPITTALATLTVNARPGRRIVTPRPRQEPDPAGAALVASRDAITAPWDSPATSGTPSG